jgi:hypothetical protein
MTLTLTAESSGAYVYVDNRALVISNGTGGVAFNRTQGRWLAEGLQIIADEQRATRMLQHRLFGGYVVDGGAVVLFAGTFDDVVSVRLGAESFAALRDELGGG